MNFPTLSELQVAINDVCHDIYLAKKNDFKDDMLMLETKLFALKYLKNKIERRERKNIRRLDNQP
jgi:hypothetical protein